MKKIISGLLLLLLCTHSSLGQRKHEIQAMREQMWGNAPIHFKKTQIPQKWKKESVVVIAQSLDIKHSYSNLSLLLEMRIHQRIKLLDKSGIEEFSAFTFDENNRKKGKIGILTPASITKSKHIFGFKIIKPTGKVFEIDLSKEAVNIKVNKDGYKKVAIKNYLLRFLVGLNCVV